MVRIRSSMLCLVFFLAVWPLFLSSTSEAATETASASPPISSKLVSGVDLRMTNLQGNHTIFRSIFAGNTTTCSEGNTTTSEIKPGESRSLEVELGWSGLICVRVGTTYYHARLAVGKDLPLNARLIGTICDNSLPNMKPGSDCSSFTCSPQNTSWSCLADHRDGHVIIALSASLIRSRGEKGDGVVFSGALSRTKLNPCVMCVVLVSLLLRSWDALW